MKITTQSIATVGIALLALQSCKKNPAPPVPGQSTYTYYPLTVASTDSTKYNQHYYYDTANQLTGFATDSLDDSLIYNSSNQIILRTINHLKPSFSPQITLPRVDSIAYRYDNANHIVAYLSPNHTTGLNHVIRSFTYNAANKIITDTTFSLLGNTIVPTSRTRRVYDAAGDVDTATTYYFKNHYKLAPNGDSITLLTTSYQYSVTHPARNIALNNATRIAIGDFNKPQNASSQHVTTAYKTDGTVEYSYTYFNMVKFDPASLMPVSAIVTSSPAAAGSGPYHVSYTYKAVSKL